MQVLNIALYNNNGETRKVIFKPNSLNVITGKSRTGKSAIISIIVWVDQALRSLMV